MQLADAPKDRLAIGVSEAVLVAPAVEAVVEGLKEAALAAAEKDAVQAAALRVGEAEPPAAAPLADTAGVPPGEPAVDAEAAAPRVGDAEPPAAVPLAEAPMDSEAVVLVGCGVEKGVAAPHGVTRRILLLTQSPM